MVVDAMSNKENAAFWFGMTAGIVVSTGNALAFNNPYPGLIVMAVLSIVNGLLRLTR